MRTVIIILGGFLLLMLCLGVAKIGSGNQASYTLAIKVFIGLWLAIAAINMWVGITKAGYGFMEELPIFLAIFLLPAGVAMLIQYKFYN
jgi:hypothetical protein